ncbi:MAG: hypothetical protein ACWGHH_06610 [Sulfurovaceae bacterium]
MALEKYRILAALQNINSVDKYTFVLIDIIKDVDSNMIKKVLITQKNLKQNLIFDDTSRLTSIATGAASRVVPDYIISNVKGFRDDFMYFDVFNLKDEHSLIMNYINYYTVIENKAKALQNFFSGIGAFLVDNDSSPARWKISYGDIDMSTIALMLSIDVILKNKSALLLKAIKGLA